MLKKAGFGYYSEVRATIFENPVRGGIFLFNIREWNSRR